MKSAFSSAKAFEYRPSHEALLETGDGRSWLALMHLDLDDRFGIPLKENGAVLVDHNFQSDGGSPRERISFDTVTNALPEAFYAEAAGLTGVTFLARVDAPEWKIQVFRRTGFLMPLLVAEASGSGAEEIELPVSVRKAPDTRLSVTITYRGAMSSDLLAFVVPKPDKLVPLGVSITTYNKPEYLLRNLEVIRKSGAYRSKLIDLIVVNNGDPIKGLPEDIEVLHPGNIGGTGGFGVAMSHFGAKGKRHFVIMDDDILLPPNTVDRFFALSCFVKGRHVGSLAEIENTAGRIVKEQGADIDRRHVFGIRMHHPLLDIHGWFFDVLYRYKECDYSGWWALMVDLSAAQTVAVPSYYFIKRDDITFGFESRRTGTPTVVFPNLLVAHSEEGAASYGYFDARNDLVMRARNNDVLGISIKGLLTEVLIKFLTYRLDDQRMFNKAMIDFMKGPEWLASRPVGEVLGDVRKLAGERIPLPTGHPVIRSTKSVPRRKMLTAWLRPSAWREPDPLPMVPSDHRACVTEIGGYIRMAPFSDYGIVYRRRPANILALANGLFQVTRLALTRRRLVARYKENRG